MEIKVQPELDGDGSGRKKWAVKPKYEAVKPFLDQMSVVMAIFLASLSTARMFVLRSMKSLSISLAIAIHPGTEYC